MKNQSKGQRTLYNVQITAIEYLFLPQMRSCLGKERKKKTELHLAAGSGWFVYVEGQHTHTHTQMEPPREGESTKPNQTIQIKTQSNSHVPHPVSSYNF